MLKSFGADELHVYKPYKHHYEIKKGEMPPSVTTEELKKLNVLQTS